jgi:hypothetical protein
MAGNAKAIAAMLKPASICARFISSIPSGSRVV